MMLRSRKIDNQDEPVRGDNNNAKDPEAKEKSSQMTYVVFISLIIDLLAFTLILPLLPTLLDHYRRHDSPKGLYLWLESKVKWFGDQVGAPDETLPVLFGGLIGSMFSFLQFIASPMIGGLSDFYGRRPLMLACALGIAGSYAIWAFASTFAIFIVARFVGGLSKGNVSLSTSVVADVSTPKTRQKGMALIGIAFSVGFLIGPMMGAAFSAWSKSLKNNESWYIYPAMVAFILSLLDLVYIWIFFKETLPESKRRGSLGTALKESLSYVNPLSLFNFSTIQDLKEKQSLVTLGRSYFVYLFLYSGLEFTLTFLTHLRFGFTSMDQGKMFLYIGLLMAFIQGGYVRRITPGREKQIALYGLLLIVPSFAIVGFAQTRFTLYFGITLYAMSTSVVVTCLNTVVSSYGSQGQKGIIMGVYRSLGALGRALGPIVASTVYWVAGPELCYALGGLGLILPYVMIKRS